MKLFKSYEINPFSVQDKVTFRNVDETLTLYVRADASMIISNLNKVNKRLSAITNETAEEDQVAVAISFAEAIFGDKQAEMLKDFYSDDPLAIITACGKYFQERLSKIITKAQKK